MKLFPVRIEKYPKILPPEVPYIEVLWKFHNKCNYACSFCGPANNDGTSPWLTLDENKLIIDKLVTAASGKPLWISFLGGEPTIYPEFLELVAYIKSKGCWVNLVSNGSRTLRWWRELKEAGSLDSLAISVHLEQGADQVHVCEVINLFHDTSVVTNMLITMSKHAVQETIDAHKYIVEHVGADVLFKVMNLQEYVLSDYMSIEQQNYVNANAFRYGKLRDTKVHSNIPDKYHNSKNVVNMTMNDGTSNVMSAQLVARKDMNHFYGWQCHLGATQVYIDVNQVYRGTCRHSIDAPLNILTEPFSFYDTPIKCSAFTCLCTAEIIVAKNKSSE